MKNKPKRTKDDQEVHKCKKNILGEIEFAGKDDWTERVTVTEKNLFGLDNVLIFDDKHNSNCFPQINPGEICVVEEGVSNAISPYVVMCGGIVLKFSCVSSEIFSELPWTVIKRYMTGAIHEINPRMFVFTSKSFKNLVPKKKRSLIPETDSLILFPANSNSILKCKTNQRYS
ncbi:hypothetical protein [Desulfobacter latus]|uniref:Uncharacterized protein n=1 Tax=Desulfobacter latus TaxID=2292 RepID=A0A850SXY3_9BACT|nr:hypothetical protein [Desulfobacter latus]NWH06174.1 hypothetical protein [Desulfobacter latus]